MMIKVILFGGNNFAKVVLAVDNMVRPTLRPKVNFEVRFGESK